MAGELIGALRVTLGLDTAQFEDGVKGAQRKARDMEKSMKRWGDRIQNVGTVISAGITLPFAALLSKAIPAAKESRAALGQVEAALKSMGPASQRTAEQLQAAAKQLETISLFDDDDILRKSTANLLTFGNIAGEQFDRAQLAVVNIAARLQTDLQPAALMVGKALNDPVKGLAALRRVGIQFTEQQQKQIKAMAEAGNVAGAQTMMLKELERQFGGSAAAMRASDPTAQTQQAWRNFQETVGEIALKVLPKLTDALDKLLGAFDRLTPAQQNFAVAATAAVAALGPIMMVLGPIVSGLGGLIPLLVQAGPAAAGAAGGASAMAGAGAALLRVLGPIGLAAGAAYTAWKNWESIEPVVLGFVDRFKKSLGDLQARMSETSKGIDDLDRRLGMPTRAEFFESLKQKLAESYQAWLDGWAKFEADTETLEAGISRFAKNAWTAFEQLHARASAAFQRLIEGARRWLVDGLSRIWTDLKERINSVGDLFHGLYMRVVGGSIIPDMVREIGVVMRGLEQEMVTPAKTAAEKTKQVMEQLRSELNSILSQLYPEVAAENQFIHEVEVLEQAMKKGILTAKQYADAVERAAQGVLTQGPEMFGGASTDELREDMMDETGAAIERAIDAMPEFEAKVGETTAQIADHFAQMAVNVIGSVRGLVDQLKSGDILGALQSFIAIVSQVIGIVDSIGNLGKGGGSSIPTGNPPGFRTGGSFKVGGSGNPDSKLVSFRASPGEIVDIRKPGARERDSVVVYVRKGEMFDAEVERVARPMVEDGVVRGAAGGAVISGRQQYRRNKAALA